MKRIAIAVTLHLQCNFSLLPCLPANAVIHKPDGRFCLARLSMPALGLQTHPDKVLNASTFVAQPLTLIYVQLLDFKKLNGACTCATFIRQECHCWHCMDTSKDATTSYHAFW